MLPEVIPFHEQHDECVELFMSVDCPEKLSRIPLCKDLPVVYIVFRAI